MNRKCKWCGQSFTPQSSRKGNAQKYCSQSCRAKAYDLERKLARERYNKDNPRIRSHNILCEWCAKPFVSTKNRKYCSIHCRKEARKEANVRYQTKYRLRRGKSDKQKYFENLGTSNLREHRHQRFADELRLIKTEKRRLHI